MPRPAPEPLHTQSIMMAATAATTTRTWGAPRRGDHGRHAGRPGLHRPLLRRGCRRRGAGQQGLKAGGGGRGCGDAARAAEAVVGDDEQRAGEVQQCRGQQRRGRVLAGRALHVGVGCACACVRVHARGMPVSEPAAAARAQEFTRGRPGGQGRRTRREAAASSRTTPCLQLLSFSCNVHPPASLHGRTFGGSAPLWTSLRTAE